MFGFFLNTIVLRTGIKATDSLSSLIENVKAVVNNGLSHQEYSFDALLHDLKIPRTANRTPLFDVQVDYVPHLYDQNFDDGLITAGDVQMKYIAPKTVRAQYDITFHFTDKEEYISGALVYCSKLFSAQTIARLVDNYQSVLSAIVDNPSALALDIIKTEQPQNNTRKVSMKLNF